MLFPVFEGTCLTTNYGNVFIGVGVLHASSKTLVNSSKGLIAVWLHGQLLVPKNATLYL
jgi:hypothetical protein